MLYALKHRASNGHGHSRWNCFAICAKAAPLERVRSGLMAPSDWRVVAIAGSVDTVCLAWRNRAVAALERRAG